MSTKQAYAVEGQPKLLRIIRIDGYVLGDRLAFQANWDEESQTFQMRTEIRSYGPAADVYKAITWALQHGIERIELTGTFQI